MTIPNRFEMRLAELKGRFARSLPGRVEEIAETLRRRQDYDDGQETLDRQFHNLAGTAGSFGFLSIAAVAADGFDECAEAGSGPISGEARYLWSIVEDLAYAASGEHFNAPDPTDEWLARNDGADRTVTSME